MGVNGSPMGLTPHLDHMARQGTRFLLPLTNQPVCAPARACLLTGEYATTHGVWRNGIGLAPGRETLATRLSAVGYQTGYVGKWHLAPHEHGPGPVPPEYRAGFTDFWEAANATEMVSQPFETVLYDAQGQEVRPPGYRVDATTDRTIAALRHFAPSDRPFFLMVSYLEPHHQNDVDRYVAPEGYADRYANPFVPPDLRPLPGNWGAQLPGYYGCVASLDENVGRLLETLRETGQLDHTIVVYTADHGCHFRTRNGEYKRSCHDSSLRVPLVISGPGFDRRQVIPEPVGLVDLAPTLLEAAGIPVPPSVQGRSMLPLVRREAEACATWPQETFVQISESMTGRALRSERWTYCATALKDADHRTPGGGTSAPGSEAYVDSHLYDNFADPFQHVNLVGHRQHRDIATTLRERLTERMVNAGEPPPAIRAHDDIPP
ncbi:MAG: sulfatase-like hydrolase/transferase [Chloroflexota bacterium]|nr:sulfatase-like hydrolase/transferase [Chloroflexota bacterium]